MLAFRTQRMASRLDYSACTAGINPAARLRRAFFALIVLFAVSPAHAGLYYSGEEFAKLPSQWRGFLLDQRTLRNLAIAPAKDRPDSPLREHYLKEADRLRKAARDRKPTADEAADLGALLVRLGESARAVEVLREAQRAFPKDFRIAANLGTAWQMNGDLTQAASALEQAVRLAPANLKEVETLHLKLVQLRQKDKKGLDDLFGVRWVNDDGKYEPGKLAAAERKKLPDGTAAALQQLALTLPADGALLWQLGELANAHGDTRTAAAIFDGCVNEFGMGQRELRDHRQATRAAVEADTKVNPDDVKATHLGHGSLFAPQSPRPLVRHADELPLPAIDPKGVNALPWTVIGDTTLDRKFKPTFPKYLSDLDGKSVTLSGYMQPLGEEQDVAAFLFVENPIGCWYCETPGLTGIIYVELPPDHTFTLTHGQITVTGTLSLNGADPENFLYRIRKAKVKQD